MGNVTFSIIFDELITVRLAKEELFRNVKSLEEAAQPCC